MESILNIAVFASGTGTTLQALIDKQQEYGYRVAQVVTNRTCIALERAQAAAIPTLQSKNWEEIDQALTEKHVQLIVLAGFLAIIPDWICQKWEQRIINIHPSLLPKHGGKGMYGDHVHEAVVAAGDKESGITIHLIDERYDCGTTFFQATCPVLPTDTPHDVAQKVHALEYEHFPHVIAEILATLE